ncbi:hypothetical protein ITJ44_08970 [Clavibacter sp. VKM Ac-2873]|uniref:hypothetical protein n=1 Tax=Clavibacter sp. VKM Ac-2873 TaxID=2783813 RepID=UPI00188CE102|nr:hypothetical protein [Clavibacter sp. VKM Ac-2873]MBF4618201.1 hypothetical protein [Clavibacter sp. VKM Ac-2873]
MSVAATIALRLNERREQRRTERTEQAGRILELLEAMGTAGMDPHLDAATAQRAHEQELHRLRWIIRAGTVDFRIRRSPTEMPTVLTGLFSTYCTVLVVGGFVLLESPQAHAESPARASTLALGILFFIGGLVGLLSMFAAWTARNMRRKAMRVSGLEPVVRLASVRETADIARTRWRAARVKRARRREAAAMVSAAGRDGTPGD